jgi:hypothetical protein
MTTNYDVERGLIELVATDRIEIPISSMSGKLKKQKPHIAQQVADSFSGNRYSGERVYARVTTEDKMKARGMREGVEMFAEQFPEHGAILNGMIEYQRAVKESHLYFGMKDGCRITSDDYMGVMSNLGFSPGMAQELYPALMDVSRKLSRQRVEERSIMIG